MNFGCPGLCTGMTDGVVFCFSQVLHEVKTLAKGVTGVPFFIVDNKYFLSGAQDADTFLKVFNKL